MCCAETHVDLLLVSCWVSLFSVFNVFLLSVFNVELAAKSLSRWSLFRKRTCLQFPADVSVFNINLVCCARVPAQARHTKSPVRFLCVCNIHSAAAFLSKRSKILMRNELQFLVVRDSFTRDVEWRLWFNPHKHWGFLSCSVVVLFFCNVAYISQWIIVTLLLSTNVTIFRFRCTVFIEWWLVNVRPECVLKSVFRSV